MEQAFSYMQDIPESLQGSGEKKKELSNSNNMRQVLLLTSPGFC